MAVTDFLKEGAEIPAGSALTATTTTSQGPTWLTDYTKQLLANQAATGGAAYSPYTGTRIAPFNNDQINSFQQTRDAARSFQPGLDAAMGTAGRAAGTSGSGQAQPFITQAQDYTNAAAAQPGGTAYAQPYANSATGAINAGLSAPGGAAYAQPYIGAGTAAVNAGLGQQTGAQAGAGAFEGALGTIGQGVNQQTGSSAAQPWLSAAGGNVANVDEYMNPYTSSVVDRIGELGVRNLNEKIMPGLEGRYIKAGQFQGSGQMTDTARAVRDTSADILAQQSAALNQGYTQAQTAKAADLSRYGTLGQTAGSLSEQARQNTIQGGQAAGAIGANQAGAAEAARQNTITGGQALGQMGATMGNLGTQDRTSTMQGGQLLGQIGQDMGALGVQDRNATLQAGQQTGQLGQAWGNLGAQDAQNLNSAAQTQGQLAGKQQELGLAGANAINAGGNQQQALDQKNMDTGYADYLRQQGYPQEQIDAQVKTLSSLQPGMPSTVSKEGIEPINGATQSPGTAANIASGLTGAAGLLEELRKSGIV